MEFPIVVIGATSFLISFGSACFWIGLYLERLYWNKLIYEGKIPKPQNAPKRFGNPIFEGKYYDAGHQE